MNEVKRLLLHLNQLGIRLWSEQGGLRFEAPKGVMTTTIRGRIKAAKAELLALLRDADAGRKATLPDIRPVPRERPLPLSFAQRRLWFLHQMETQPGIYNITMGFHLTGPLHALALERSLAGVLHRHEALRTLFPEEGGKPGQIAREPQPFCLTVLDLGCLDGPGRDATRAALVQGEALRPFRLDQGPLYHFSLMRLGPGEHRLGGVVHHIVFDGWSAGIFLREMSMLYRAHARAEGAGKVIAPLPPLPFQYADFAFWQRRYLVGQRMAAQLDFWRRQLAGAPALLELPTDRPRPALQTFHGAVIPFSLPASASRALAELGRAAGATMFMVLQAGFAALLARYSGQADIVVGMPTANRNRKDLEPLIGFFVNTLALRCDLGGRPSFQTLLDRVRKTAMAAFAHQDPPFEQVVAALQPPRDLNHAPLFQVMFMLREPESESVDLLGLTPRPAPSSQVTAKFDITLEIWEGGGGLAGGWEYNTDLFEAATVRRMAEHLRMLLAAACREPHRALDEIELLSAGERRHLQLSWSRTAATLPHEKGVHQLFEACVRRNPRAVAISRAGAPGSEPSRQLDYAELNRHAEGLAVRLAGLGVRNETLVGVLGGYSRRTMVGLLAVLKAGGAYVPLDRGYPPARLEAMIEDARLGLILTDAGVPGGLQHLAPRFLDLEGEAVSAQPATSAAVSSAWSDVNALQTAYVIFTSGSTGRPKGVQIPHRAVVNFLESMRVTPGLFASDIVPVVTPISFDIAVLERFLPLVCGARLELLDRVTATDGAAIAELLSRLCISTMQATPATWSLLLAAGWQGNPGTRLFCGGEALPAGLAGRLRERGKELWNLYGPTETTIWSSRYLVAPDQDTSADPVPLGEPIANTDCYILDARARPVPSGLAGELLIGGTGLARGYFDGAGLTARSFVPHLFSSRPGERLYRTGDRVRNSPHGALMFIGRIDQQVKLRGFRIEPGDIEAALMQHARVVEAAIVVRRTPSGSPFLAAFLALTPAKGEDDHDALVPALRAFLGARLPAYMLPSAFLRLKKLPRTPSGKIDRKKLPRTELVEALSTGTAAYTAPRNVTEEILAAIWTDVLGRHPIGVFDNFFELGGHSLLATQVLARVADALHVRLHPRELFERPTIASLAPLLTGAGGEDQGPPPKAEPRDGPLPLSFAQQRLWFLGQLNPDHPFYNLANPIRLTGRLDTQAAEEALTRLVARHETLRTRFEDVNGEPAQVISPQPMVRVPLVDVSCLSVPARERLVAGLTRLQAQLPFRLNRGPLIRPHLLRSGANAHLFLLTLHHIIADAWSMGVLIQELAAFYSTITGDGPPPRPLPIQYADFARWQRSAPRVEQMEKQLEFWRERLGTRPGAHAPPLDLPTDRPRPRLESHRGANLWGSFPASLAMGVKQLSGRANATSFMTVLAAFKVLLARYSRQWDIAVGTPIANRQWLELEPLIGFFANTLVLRTDLSGNPRFRELLARVRDNALEAHAHQDVPFEGLVDALRVKRDLSRAPLFQVLFVWQNAPRPRIDLGQGLLTMEGASIDSGIAKFDLTLFAWEAPSGELATIFEYNTDLYEEATIQRMAGHLGVLLRAAVDDPDLPIARLPLLTEEERQRLLSSWNECDGGAAFSGPMLPHRFVAQCARRLPDAVALIGFSEHPSLGHWSHARLDASAEALARRLRAMGVGPETFVALCAERSPELVIAILAILKAGGAYVPLDPAYPAERLRFMIDDSQARPLLTQAHLAENLAAIDCPLLLLGREGTEPGTAGGETVEPQDRNPAYMIYTSGSTGRPKGVVLEHRVLANLILWQQRAVPHPRKTLQFSSISFDASFQELFSAWMFGGSIQLVSEHTRKDPRALSAFLQTHAVERLFLPFIALQQLAEQARESAALPTALREVMTAGEQLQVTPALRELFRALPRCRLYNFYGPTESHVVTAETLAADVACWPALPPIGTAIDCCLIHILDSFWEPLPAGVPGELCIGGTLARGYFGRPDLSADRFRPAPFGLRPGARLYRSGDLARMRADGVIEFLGRFDHQVKIRGFRVEPEEIENLLTALSGIGEAAVIPREDQPGHKYLAAYVAAPKPARSGSGMSSVAGNPMPDWQTVRAHLKARLPEYMLPARFQALDSLPLTPGGKVDRAALRARLAPMAVAAANEPHLPPRSPEEKVLAAIWAEVLGLERVSANADFFEIGGHSLLATRVISRIRERARVALPLRTLFETPVLADLASRLADRRGEGRVDVSPAPAPVPRDRELPLSFAQQRLWFLNRFEGPSSAYNVAAATRLKGRLDVAAAFRCLDLLAQRHEPLRTVFAETGGRPRQVILPPAPVALALVDISALAGEARESEIRRLVDAEGLLPFDLEGGPLFRFTLIRSDCRDHRLLTTMHHMIADGWSLSLFIREMAQLYQALLDGLPDGEAANRLPRLILQYADYAYWQRRRLASPAMETHLAYWRGQLAGLPALQGLPTDHPRPPVQTYRGGEERFRLDPHTGPALLELGRANGATPFMVLSAVFALLIARLSGRQDVVLGTPIANRNHSETEPLIGVLVNTLVLRFDLAGDPDFRELLARVRHTALEAYHHQDLPFERVVEALRPERNQSHGPLFQVMFILQNNPEAEVIFRGLRLEPMERESRSAKFELTLAMQESGAGVEGILEFNADLFERATIRRWAGWFGNLAAALAREPAAPVSHHGLMEEEERRAILVDWNRTEAAMVGEPRLEEVFAAQAGRTPDAPALIFIEGVETDDTRPRPRTLTYAALGRRARLLAGYLRRRGVGPGEPVGIRLQREPELIAGLLAILMAGGAYLPLDPGYPAARLSSMLAGAGARWLLTSREVSGSFEPAGSQRLFLEDFRAHQETELAAPRVPSGAAAYFLFTSGSTGRAKGIAASHDNVLNRLSWMWRAYPFRNGEVACHKTSLCFVDSVWEIFGPLLRGVAALQLDDGQVKDPRRMVPLLAAAGVSRVVMVPSLLRALLDSWPDLGRRLSRLDSWCLSGEVLAPALVHRFREQFPHARLLNLYGSTEVCGDVSCYDVPRVALSATIAVGRPIANTRLYVLDPVLRPLPPGVPGELLAAGANLCRGYIGEPTLTASRFPPDPFSREPGSRLFRGGDRARLVAGHERRTWQLELLGRADRQLKLRGFRIEPEEIEMVLSGHPRVRAAVLTSHEDSLVAYVQLESGKQDGPKAEKIRASDLRNFLAARLPEYMLPATFLILQRLPLLANGKVDRQRLPDPGKAGSKSAYEAPRNATEAALSVIFARVLDRKGVGVFDNFFEVGGHSLAATRVIARIRETFALDLSLQKFFGAATVAALARLVDARIDAEPVPALTPVSRLGNLPLSFAQQRLWFLHQLEGGAPGQHLPSAIRIDGHPSVAALERGLADVIARHETLRTVFPSVNGQPCQVVLDDMRVYLPVCDLSGLPSTAREERLKSLMDDQGRRSFDLERGPLLRVLLIHLEPHTRVMLLDPHHIIADGWSIGILVGELAQRYAIHVRSASPSAAPPLAIQYADFAHWQRGWLEGPRLEAQMAYWRDCLQEPVPLLRPPMDGDPESEESQDGAAESLWLEPELTQQIKSLSREEDATPFMTLLAGFAILLGRLADQRDLIIGVPIAGRNRAETEPLIGCFLNTLALRCDLSGDPGFRELLRRVRATSLRAFANQDVPFEKLVEALEPERRLSRHPFFDVLFNFVNTPPVQVEAPLLKLTGMEPGAPISPFLMTLYLAEADGGLVLRLVYRRHLFSSQRAACMLRQLRFLMEQIMREPARSIGCRSLADPVSRELLPDLRSALDRPRFPTVFEAFAARASQFPDQTALCHGKRAWTYEMLAERVRELAATLPRQGFEEGRVAALQGSRGMDLVAAMLALFALNGIVLLLEPDLPLTRRARMLDQAGARFLILLGEDAGEAPATAWPLRLIRVRPGSAATVVTTQPEGSNCLDPPREYPRDAAYIFYTSGTTGVPKGIVGGGQALAHFLHWQRDSFILGPGNRFAQFTGLSFDVVLRDLLTPLISGATLCLPTPELEADAAAPLSWLMRQSITHLHTVPSLAHAWLEYLPAATRLPALQTVFFAGEPLTAELVARWRSACPNARQVVNLYGPTETTLAKCYYLVPLKPVPVIQPIGRPLPQTQVLILDGRGRHCGIGEPGEIVVRTPFRSLGYLDAGQERGFVANPRGEDENDLLYYSGDLGRLRPEGVIEILGRVDDQLKLRGVRVEPAEVAAVLRQHPLVREAAVIGTRDGAGAPQLVGYAVPRTDLDAVGPMQRAHWEADVFQFLRERLPAAFLPGDLIAIGAMPRTAGGKLDRSALPASDLGRARRSADHVAPRTPDEEILAAIWSEILEVELVSMNDNFFELGGHSLMATRVVSRVRAAFKLRIPLRRFMENPTLAALKRLVEEGARKGETLPPLLSGDRSGPLPLSHAQQRLWLAHHMSRGDGAYHVPASLRVSGPLDAAILERAIAAILARHETLRTSFTTAGKEPVQVVHAFQGWTLPVVDLTRLPEQGREAFALKLAQRAATDPFDLERGPLLRAQLLILERDGFMALFNMHHIISDGWSRGVLVGEVTLLYSSLMWEHPAPLPGLPIQYGDYARWQRDYLAGPVHARELDYWRETLAGAPPVQKLPLARPEGDGTDPSGAVIRFHVSPELTQTLKARARAEDVTLFMLLLAAFEVLLACHTGERDLVVGTDVANRNRAELEGLIGFFVNQLVLRTRLEPGLSSRDMLRRVRETALGAYAHQDMPFDSLVEALNPPRRRAHAPLFQRKLVLHNMPAAAFRSDILRFAPITTDAGTTKLDLQVNMSEVDGGLSGSWHYKRALFEPAVIERLIGHYQAILKRLADRMDAQIASFEDLLTEVDRESENEQIARLRNRGANRFSRRRP